MDPVMALVLTVLLLAGNGFFVAAEFALVAAKAPRLRRAAARGSRPAAAAVAGIRNLSLMLAGAQLGITMCSLGLGVITEPAFEHLLSPLFGALGVPGTLSHIIAFTVALGTVTFLHMVIGEMVPKSWAIARPERAVMILALPFRGFVTFSRPVLTALNAATNWLLRRMGIAPRDELDTHHDPQRLRHLLGESRRLGLIDRSEHALLDRAIATRQATIDHLIVGADRVTTVPADATPAQVRRVARASGHSRLLVEDGDGALVGLTHLREAVTHLGTDRRAAEFTYPVPVLAEGTNVLAAVTRLREARAQLAVVNAPDGTLSGIVSLDDLLGEILSTNPH